MTINSINIINNLPRHRAKIINILDFNSEKLSIIKNNNDKTNVYYDNNPFFLATDGLKEEEHLKNMMMQIIQYLNLKKINI